MKKLILLGGGDLAREIESYICTYNEMPYRLISHSSSVNPSAIIPNYINIDEIINLTDRPEGLICVGSPLIKEQIDKSFAPYVQYINYISKTAICTSKIDSEGVILNPGSTTTINVTLGNHVLIQNNSVVGHDCSIGDYSTISPLAVIGGHTSIGKRCYIGSGAFIKEKLYICDDVIIGGNASVVKDIDVPGTYVGVPAKLLRKDIK